MRFVSRLAVLFIVLCATRAWAVGEAITDIRIKDNALTLEETVRSIAGISIGDRLELDTLEKVRERLNTAGLFSDVNVYWEPHRGGVRVNIVVKDKFPWAPIPTFSYSPGNLSGGLLIGHGNLFGRGKRGIVGGRISTADSGALIAYDDPAFLGTWLFWNARGKFQDQVLPEYSNVPEVQAASLTPIRETKLRSWGFAGNFGVAWLRKVRTAVGWNIERFVIRESRMDQAHPYHPGDLPPAAESTTRALGTANLTFDFRAREHAIMYGNALSFYVDQASPHFGGDDLVQYWKAGVSYEQGLRFFRRHNLVFKVGGEVGEDLPFWSENSIGGTNLRGFLYRQFMGDTMARSQVEYHFPLFSIRQLDFRGLVFHDAAAIYYRQLPEVVGNSFERRSDGRQFLPPNLLLVGFKADRDIHQSVGAGLRFFLRSVSVPLVGVDVGHAIGTRAVRLVIVIGV